MISFVSAKGPSTNVRFAPECLMRHPFEVGWSPEASSSSPAFASSSWYFRSDLLRLGEGPIDERALRSGVLDAPPLRGWLEPRGIQQLAGLRQLLVVLRHLGDELFLQHDTG